MALCDCGNRLRSHSLTQLWCLTLLSLRLDWRELELHFWLYILHALIPEWNQTKMIYRVSARMRVLVRVCIISLILALRALLSPFVVVVCSILVLSVLAGTSHSASHSPPWLTQFLCRACSLLTVRVWSLKISRFAWGERRRRTEDGEGENGRCKLWSRVGKIMSKLPVCMRWGTKSENWSR